MAKEVLRDCVITVNGVDMSDHFRTVSIPIEWDDVDFTAFGSNWKEHGKGLLDGSIEGEVYQDFAAGETDATLWPLFIADTSFPVTVKKNNAAISTTNPLWTMTAKLMNYSPLDGEVGAASKTTVKFVNASQSGVVKSTS